MSEESGEPKPRKLKLSSSRNQSEASPSEASTQEASTPAPKDNPLGSILIVIGLLCILAAAAGGIWYLLQSDASETTDDAAKAVSAEAAPRNPIERAKVTIDSVPEHALDAVLEAPQVANATTEPTAPPPEVAPAEQLKEAISEYLQNVHIGGVRTGARARIMLNGQNYDINDTVDATTGLKFIGTRQQKLLFTDPNGVTYVKSF